ncbi:MAG: response regulator transcription factor [Oscillospiraceae bacterium]|nr:response regulator transcription factor [Oscillospiraceae bacterium]
MAKILIVDDDIHIRELIHAILKTEKFDIVEAVDGEDALEKLDETKVDLCVIDIMMPNMDGFELCENIREYYKDMPILMLTAKKNIVDKVQGFNKGTDDYLTKPFENEELVIRVKSLLRRYNIEKGQIIQIGNVVIDKNTHQINVDGKDIDIPLKEFELLYKLANSKGKTISREKLIEDIWGYDFEGNERTLDVHINRLREKFQDNLIITTIRGLGYRLEEI